MKPGTDSKTGQQKNTFHTPARKNSDRKFSDHYGRQSIDMNDVMAFMVKDDIINNPVELQKLYINIAKSGVPKLVIDTQGKIIFGPKEYNNLQKDLFLNNEFEYKLNEKGEIEKVKVTGNDLNYNIFSQQKETILQCLKTKDTKQLFESLKKIPYFEKYMNGKTGVSENEEGNKILWEHTKNVMETFYKNFSNFSSPIVNEQLMGVILLLHDIGKTYAYEKLGNKELQHFVTSVMIPNIMKEFGFNQKEINIALAIIDQPLIKGRDIMTHIIVSNLTEKDIKSVAYDIRIEASKNNIDPKEYFRILQMFTIADGSVYINFQNSFSDVDGKKTWNEEIKKKMDEIEKNL
ncbi:MAG TPA: hypothetical protein PLW93_05065 [Candidatus Absconditabacterales bacterium]|nr:hypothetical protein [Candidatus Absconditabacterales bacterium]